MQEDEIQPSFPPISSSRERERSSNRKFPVTIEPILLLVFFSFALADGVTVNILISRACSIVYHLPDDKCHGEHIDPDVESLVQPYTTKITMLKSVIEAVISGVLAMFVGPWSDHNGRKPFIVFPVAGYTLYYIGWFILYHLPTVHPLWFLLPSIFFTLSGGLVSIFTCIFCYITDITNEQNRAFRMALTSSVISAGIVGGYLSSFYIIKYARDVGPTVMLSLAIGACLTSLFYAVTILPESLIIGQGQPTKFFDFKSVREMISSVSRNRPKKGRARLLLAIVVIGIGIIILQGDSSYRYFALRASFSWSLEHYNLYAAIACAISVVASAAGAFISTSMLRVHELYIALFTVLMSTLSSVLSALSRTSIEFYIFSVVGCFGALLNPMLKTQITRNVARADLGKIFAFISTIESFSPLIASPLYRNVYNNVLDHQPLAFLFLSAGFWLLSAVLITIILLIQAFCTRDYGELIIDEASEDGIAQPIDEETNEEIS